MKEDLKEIRINGNNLLLDGNVVKGGILPEKISELMRTITIQADTHVEGAVYASKMEIKNGDVLIAGAVFTQQELYINSEATGHIDFQKCVASASSVVSHAQKCQLSFHSDINAKSVTLVNAFVAGSIYADEIVLENCVVIGGLFSTQSLSITNCSFGTFNASTVSMEGVNYMLLPTAFSLERICCGPNTKLFNLCLADLGSLFRGTSESPESGKIEMNLEIDDIPTTLTGEDVQRKLNSYTVVGKVLAADMIDVDKFQNHFLLTAAALGPQLLKTYNLGADNNPNTQLTFENISKFFFNIQAGRIEIRTMDATFNLKDFAK